MRKLEIFERPGYTVDDLTPDDRATFHTLVMFAEAVLNSSIAEDMVEGIEPTNTIDKIRYEVAEETLDVVQNYVEATLHEYLVSWLEQYPFEEEVQ